MATATAAATDPLGSLDQPANRKPWSPPAQANASAGGIRHEAFGRQVELSIQTMNALCRFKADILAELVKPGGNPAVKSALVEVPSGNLYVSVLAMGEIAKGVSLLDPGPKKE